jgi:hypothetical protein
VLITGFGNAALTASFAGRKLRGHQSKVTHQRGGMSKATWIAELPLYQLNHQPGSPRRVRPSCLVVKLTYRDPRQSARRRPAVAPGSR